MQDESISTINVYDLERAARRQAYEECAAIAEDYVNNAHGNAGQSIAAAIRAKLETMP